MAINSKYPQRGRCKRFVANSKLLVNGDHEGSHSKCVPIHCIKLDEHEAICSFRSDVHIYVDSVVEILIDKRHVIGKVLEISPEYPNHRVVKRLNANGTGDGNFPPRPPRPRRRTIKLALTSKAELKGNE